MGTAVYRPLSWDINSEPTDNLKLHYTMIQDVNYGRIQDTNLSLRYVLSEGPDYRWEIESVFNYNKDNAWDINSLRTLELNRYEMQTYKIYRLEHCRAFEISYNKQMEEFRFKMTILAFPEDKVGFMKNKDLWKLEGLLDNPSAERF